MVVLPKIFQWLQTILGQLLLAILLRTNDLHARNNMRIAQEEIFGPVLTVIPFDSEEDAIAIANDSIYGLASGVHTRDLKKAHRVAHALKAGTFWVNNRKRWLTMYGSF